MGFRVLDGGLATELTRAGFSIDDDALWGARILVENPEAIRAVHTRFLESGADVLITATYQASIEGLQEHCGFDKSKALSVIRNSVKIAKDACNEFYSSSTKVWRKPLVAGSVGPYGACQHDGSEYTGDYVEKLTVQELMDWHRPRMAALVEAEVDILALETIPAQDGIHTCHGEQFSDTVTAIVGQSTQIAAVGVNCTSPLYVKSLLQSIKGRVDLPYVVYPNSGEEWKDSKWLDTGAVQPLSCYIQEWIEAGARWIGGCCRTQPKDIAKIREIVDKQIQ